MIAMPYILVNIVLDWLSLLLFCMTSAALLSMYPVANRYLPAQVRNQRALAFVAHGLVLLTLSIAVVLVTGRLRSGYRLSRFIYEFFFYIGLMNSMVLAYQFLDQRYLLNTPKLQRRLFIAIVSVIMAVVPVIAVIIAVFGLFTIR